MRILIQPLKFHFEKSCIGKLCQLATQFNGERDNFDSFIHHLWCQRSRITLRRSGQDWRHICWRK